MTAMIVPGTSAFRSVALYRRLIRNNYTQVLNVTYPVLAHLVGDRKFAMLARGYFTQHPSTSGDLFHYGRHLPSFLCAIQVAPWLSDLARLEWACHEMYQVPDPTPVSQEHMAALTMADPARVTIDFHAAIRLLWFPRPIHRIWLTHQPDGPRDGDVDLPLPEEDTGIVVTRKSGRVEVIPLAMTEYAVMMALFHGLDLASVEKMAIPEFEFQRFWSIVLNASLISGASVKEAL